MAIALTMMFAIPAVARSEERFITIQKVVGNRIAFVESSSGRVGWRNARWWRRPRFKVLHKTEVPQVLSVVAGCEAVVSGKVAGCEAGVAEAVEIRPKHHGNHPSRRENHRCDAREADV